MTGAGSVIRRQGKFLGVDPAGFQGSILRSTSIGKYRRALTPEDLNILDGFGGETLRRMGYP